MQHFCTHFLFRERVQQVEKHECCLLMHSACTAGWLVDCPTQLTVLGFSFVFHDKAKRTQQENLLQGGRSWQPFGGGKNGHKSFHHFLLFAIFATKALFLCVIANLQIKFSILCNMYHVIVQFLLKKH